MAPQVPAKKSHKVRNVVLAVVAVIVIIAVASSAGKKTDAVVATSPTSAAVASPMASNSTATGDVVVTSSTVPATSAVAAPTPKPAAGEDPKADVAITGCAPGDGGYLAAKVRVTNHSSKPSNYIVTVIFESKDGSEQLDTGLAAVNELAAGQVSNQDAASMKTAPKAGYTCKVGDVTRYAS